MVMIGKDRKSYFCDACHIWHGHLYLCDKSHPRVRDWVKQNKALAALRKQRKSNEISEG